MDLAQVICDCCKWQEADREAAGGSDGILITASDLKPSLGAINSVQHRGQRQKDKNHTVSKQ